MNMHACVYTVPLESTRGKTLVVQSNDESDGQIFTATIYNKDKRYRPIEFTQCVVLA